MGKKSPDGPVSIDLLTPQDIMSMRKENQAQRQQDTNLDLDKVYLVMTYAVAFDR